MSPFIRIVLNTTRKDNCLSERIQIWCQFGLSPNLGAREIHSFQCLSLCSNFKKVKLCLNQNDSRWILWGEKTTILSIYRYLIHLLTTTSMLRTLRKSKEKLWRYNDNERSRCLLLVKTLVVSKFCPFYDHLSDI